MGLSSYLLLLLGLLIGLVDTDIPELLTSRHRTSFVLADLKIAYLSIHLFNALWCMELEVSNKYQLPSNLNTKFILLIWHLSF